MNIFEFMSDSPWLSFFLAWLVMITITTMVRWIVILIRGYSPPTLSAKEKVLKLLKG